MSKNSNNKKLVEAITPMDVDFAQWYTDIVKKAEMIEYSTVKGAVILRPYGYALWENIQGYLDRKFKETGHENVYMPMLIPESLLQKEKDHVEGFAPEDSASDRHQRHFSASISQTSSNPTMICQNCTISGAVSSDGRRPQDHS
jgi:prolyl-tRNA synthetase